MDRIVPPVDKTKENKSISAHALKFNASSWLSDFIETLPCEADIKDARNGQYLLCNYHMQSNLGLTTATDLIGLTIADLFSENGFIVKSNPGAELSAWRSKELERTRNLEHRVSAMQRPCRMRASESPVRGFIHIDEMIKVPIPDRNHKKVIAFLTYYNNVTSKFNLLDLFQLYQQYYPDTQAIQKLLKYLKLDSYFIKLPTVKEMQILLALHGQSNRKKAARLFNISHNTLASHLQHLKEKLIVPDLNAVLMQLRAAPLDTKSRQKSESEYECL